jgi:MoxR-like ATPase
MGPIPEQDGNTDLVEQLARAIGAAQDELWPVRRRHQPHLRPEDVYGRAAAAALSVVRHAIDGIEPPEFLVEDVGWDAHRLAVFRMLGGAQ